MKWVEEGSGIENLVDNLFRREYSKLVSYLTPLLNGSIQSAEDIAQEALYEACKSWRDNTVPENPTAWLFKVAKRKAFNYSKHISIGKRIINESFNQERSYLNEEVLETEILDGMLKLFFACCSPQLRTDNQVILTLNTLCGFSGREIALVLTLEEEVVKKRLVRIKQKIRQGKIELKIPTYRELPSRLNAVNNILYLMFLKGYDNVEDGQSSRSICLESMRLAKLIIERFKESSDTNALLALMCFHTARFDSRVNNQGTMNLLEDQDRELWDKTLIKYGVYYLSEASESKGDLSTYHIEANIAALHCQSSSIQATDWIKINQLYNWLYVLKPSPITLLNIAISEAMLKGYEYGLKVLESCVRKDQRLIELNLYHAAKAKFYEKLQEYEPALKCYSIAHELSENQSQRRFLLERIHSLNDKIQLNLHLEVNH